MATTLHNVKSTIQKRFKCLKEMGVEIKLSQLYESYAKENDFENWDTCSGYLNSEDEIFKLIDSVKDLQRKGSTDEELTAAKDLAMYKIPKSFEVILNALVSADMFCVELYDHYESDEPAFRLGTMDVHNFDTDFVLTGVADGVVNTDIRAIDSLVERILDPTEEQ